MKRYPIYIDGEEQGELRVFPQGLYTVFTARAKGQEPLCLWLTGDGKSVKLGRILPCGGELLLRRKLSRNDMRAFPSKVEYGIALPQGVSPDENGDSSPAPRQEESASAGQSERPLPAGAGTASPRRSRERTWYELQNGSLLCFENGQTLIALPAQLRDKSLVSRRINVINGREYLVFRR